MEFIPNRALHLCKLIHFSVEMIILDFCYLLTN